MMSPSLQDYEVISLIGSGSYGTCKKVRRIRDDKIFVSKEIAYGHMTEKERSRLVSEVNVLKRLRHSRIVRYHERIVDKKISTLFLIMEYCEGGDLASLISDVKKQGRYMEEFCIWKVCGQIAEGLAVCHGTSQSANKILHRDLKPANIFLDRSHNIKLGDFGLARILDQDEKFAQTMVGTPYYMSPEQMTLDFYDEKSDIWSLGCLLYEMAALVPPFTGRNHMALASRICSGKYCRLPSQYSDDLQNLISSMLLLETKKRPSVADILSYPRIQEHLSEAATEVGPQENSEVLRKIKPIVQKLQERKANLQHWEQALCRWEKELHAKEQALQLKRRSSQRRRKCDLPRRQSSKYKENQDPAKQCLNRDQGEHEFHDQMTKPLRNISSKFPSPKKERICSPQKDGNKLKLVQAIRHSMEKGDNKARTYTVSELKYVQADYKATRLRRRSAPETPSK